MTSLQYAYSQLACDEEIAQEYDRLRATKVVEIADYIRDYMREPQHAEAVADAIMSSAEEMSRIEGDCIHGELASRYTVTGNPLVVSL